MGWTLWKRRSVLQKKVKETDYELYVVPVPFNCLFGKKRNQYLFSELEKRHPCFSSEFCFDSKLRVSKKGFESNVVVMEKKQLSFYRRNNYFKIFGLSLENSNKKFVFSRVKFSVIFLIVSISIVLLIFISCFCRNGKNNSNEVLENPDYVYEIKSKEIYNPQNCLEQFFITVKQSEGKISQFVWNTTESLECFSASLTDVFPENFLTIADYSNFSPISYVDSKPSITYFQKKMLVDFIKQKSVNVGDFEKHQLFMERIHQILRGNRIDLIEESREPFSIQFLISSESISSFTSINSICSDFDFCVSEVKFNKQSENKILVNLTFDFENTFQSGFPLFLIDDYKQLLINPQNPVIKRTEVLENKIKNDEENGPLKKIGSVQYKNGNKVVFYKNQEGKLIKKEEL